MALSALKGDYPTDPMIPFREIMSYFSSDVKDIKVLIHAIYDLAGYCLFIGFGPSQSHEVTSHLNEAIAELHANKEAIPQWLFPMLLQMLQAAIQAVINSKIPAPTPTPSPLPNPKIQANEPSEADANSPGSVPGAPAPASIGHPKEIPGHPGPTIPSGQSK